MIVPAKLYTGRCLAECGVNGFRLIGEQVDSLLTLKLAVTSLDGTRKNTSSPWQDRTLQLRRYDELQPSKCQYGLQITPPLAGYSGLSHKGVMMTNDEIFYRALRAQRPPASVPLNDDYMLTTNPIPRKDERLAIRLSNLVSNSLIDIFAPLSTDRVLDEKEIDSMGGVKIPHPKKPNDFLCATPKPFLRDVFTAARHIRLNTLTPANLNDWIARLTLLQGIDVHFFFKEETPYVPTCKELASVFGIEFFGIKNMPQEKFVSYLIAFIDRKTALDLQSGLAGELPSENFLPFESV